MEQEQLRCSQLVEIKDDIQKISEEEKEVRNNIYDVLQRRVSKLYLKQSKSFLIQHQIQSYNLLFEKQLREAIEGFNPIIENQNYKPELQDFETKFEIRFKNISFKQPYITESDGYKILLTPQLARLRYCNYLTQMQCDIEVTQQSYVEKKEEEEQEQGNDGKVLSVPGDEEIQQSKTKTVEYQQVIHKKEFKNFPFAKIPVMVGSKACVSQQINMLDRNECEFDLGGYFIIQGNEKVIISQDRICENKIFVFKNNKNQMQNYQYRAEVRSTNQRYYSSNKLFKIQLSTKSNQNGKFIRCTIQNIKKEVPLFVLFRALGIETDSEIINICGHQFKNDLAGSIFDANSHYGIYEQQNALQFLEDSMSIQAYNIKEKEKEKGFTQNKKMKRQFLTDILKSEFLCHIEGGTFDKIIFLRDMVEALILTEKGLRNVDDRDSQCNKRIEPPGILMVKLFRQHFNKYRKYIKSQISKEMKQQPNRTHEQCIITQTNKDNIFKSIQIEQGLRSSLSTGFWGDKNNQSARPGVAQVLNRMNYASTCSHLRRINTHLEKNDKTVIGPRYIHNSQCFYICPVESPEGGQIGLVKNLALSAQITHGSNYQQLIDVIDQMLKLERITQENFQEKYFQECKLEINGQKLYYIENSLETYKKLLDFKRRFIIDYQTSVIFDYRQNIVKLNIEAGRLTRPLFITESLKRLLDKNDKQGQQLLSKIQNYKKQQVVNFYDEEQHNRQITSFYQLMYNTHFPLIEFVDTLQSEQGILIAMDINSEYFNESQYTEIEPSFMLSLMSVAMPYSNANQAPRNAYYTSMAKQAIGIHTTTHKQRFDTTSNVLNQLQMPLIKTHMHEYTNMDKMPFGQNVTIAVMCYTGFNQEDSIIMNKSAVERGLFHHTQYKTYKEKNIGNLATGEEEVYKKITQNRKKSNNYSKINDSGLVDVGRYVQQGDVIMSKQLEQKGQNNETKVEDTSYALKNNETGYIDSIVHQDNFFKTKDHEAHQFTKVRIRLTKWPVLGDKFASIHAQKGLLGKILPEEDMPYSQNGIKPDVIINPHAFPSRMTIGQLLEILHGNICLNTGKRGYGDTFNTMSVEQMKEMLTTLGLNSDGNSVFYNGFTGDQFECDVFSGSCYMIRLKHLADNKIHAREISGPITVVTRQPSEGRQKKGGLKFGYMEIDCQLAHGQYSFLREKMLDTSDLFQIIICNNCNTQQQANITSENFFCRVCKSSTDFTVTYHNYSTNIFMKELQQMNIKMKYITDKVEE